MTDRETLIKELSEMYARFQTEAEHYLREGKKSVASILSDAAVMMKRSRAALLEAKPPVDAERAVKDLLGEYATAHVELLQRLESEMKGLLRRPVEPVVMRWRMMVGDWRDETVALHGPNGLITSGLTNQQAADIIAAHGGVSTDEAALNVSQPGVK